MSEILSQDEINALLAAYGSVNGDASTDSPGMIGKEVRIYDFLSPDRFSKEDLRSLNGIHTDVAAGLTTTLSIMYQLPTCVNLIGVDQVTYKEYRASVPTKTLIAEISAEPLASCMIMEVNPSIVGMWVDYFCGGNPLIEAAPSELTPIDLAVAKRVLASCLQVYSDSWSGMITVNPEIGRVSSSESYDEPLAPSEPVLVCGFEISTGDLVGMMTVCIPAVGIESVLPNLLLSRQIRGSAKHQDKRSADRIRRSIEHVNIPCKVILGEASVALSDARNLKVGDVIKMERPAGAKLDMYVGNAHLFNCRPGVRGKNIAVVVTEANDLEESESTVQPNSMDAQLQQVAA